MIIAKLSLAVIFQCYQRHTVTLFFSLFNALEIVLRLRCLIVFVSVEAIELIVNTSLPVLKP